MDINIVNMKKELRESLDTFYFLKGYLLGLDAKETRHQYHTHLGVEIIDNAIERIEAVFETVKPIEVNIPLIHQNHPKTDAMWRCGGIKTMKEVSEPAVASSQDVTCQGCLELIGE